MEEKDDVIEVRHYYDLIIHIDVADADIGNLPRQLVTILSLMLLSGVCSEGGRTLQHLLCDVHSVY
jgi:hypothetical protein